MVEREHGYGRPCASGRPKPQLRNGTCYGVCVLANDNPKPLEMRGRPRPAVGLCSRRNEPAKPDQQNDPA